MHLLNTISLDQARLILPLPSPDISLQDDDLDCAWLSHLALWFGHRAVDKVYGERQHHFSWSPWA